MDLSKSKYKWVAPGGRIHELKPGEAYLALRWKDFTCEPSSFAGAVRRIASELGWKVTVVTTDSQVVWSFYQATAYLRPNLPAYPVVQKLRR